MNAESVAPDLGRDAVDEKGHVVVDDLDHGVGRLPTMLLQPRVVDPELHLAWLSHLRRPKLRQRRAIEIQQVALGQILGRHVAEVGPHELLRARRIGALETGTQLLDQRVDDLGLTPVAGEQHRCPLILCRPVSGVSPPHP